MKTIRNEKGVALVTALLLTLVALAIVMAVLYFVMQGTQLSAAQKRYKNSLEASHGGAEVFTKEIIPYVFANNTTGGLATKFTGINLQIPVSNACFQQKLYSPTSQWTNCSADSKTLDPKSKPDMILKLNGLLTQPGFNVATKIVDTSPGNSDMSGFALLDSGSGVTGTSSGVSPKHIPAQYRIEVEGERESNSKEKAQLTVLYAY